MAAKRQEELIKTKKEFYNLYENEAGSDVILLVGEEECRERIPAHTWVLATGSDYFRSQFYGPMAMSGKKEYRYPDDDINGFNNFIRWLYQSKCDLQSLQSSLDTLHTAIKYLCPDLAVMCVDEITKQLNAKNVLKVVQNIQWHLHHLPQTLAEDFESSTPSAPSLDSLENDKNAVESFPPENFVDPTICCQHLFNECLDIVDKNSVEVLNSEHFINSDESLVRMVVSRSTLKGASEMDIFRALHRWSTAVCKRQHWPLTMESRRKVLGSLLFHSRLLTTNLQEIESSKSDLSLLLYDEEINYLIGCVRTRSTAPIGQSKIPSTLVDHLTLLSTPRNLAFNSGENKKEVEMKTKKKSVFKRRFNKKEIILDLVSVLALIFD